jgi:hypothetical protein
MDKLKLLGLGNNENRSYFIFKKRNAFFLTFPFFLEELGLEKIGILYEHSENDVDIREYVDIQENVKNDVFDVDIFFGEDKFIVVVRTDEFNRPKLMRTIKKIANYPGFDN